jgi:hypothetical protein
MFVVSFFLSFLFILFLPISLFCVTKNIPPIVVARLMYYPILYISMKNQRFLTFGVAELPPSLHKILPSLIEKAYGVVQGILLEFKVYIIASL